MGDFTPITQVKTGKAPVGSAKQTFIPISAAKAGHGTSQAKKKGGGLLGGLTSLAGKTGSGLYHAAVNTPGGLYVAGKALGGDIENAFTHPGRRRPKGSTFYEKVAVPTAKSAKQTVQHPLRDPAGTLLNLAAVASLGAGSVARAGEVGRVASEGATVGKIAKAAVRGPKPGVRTFKVGDLSVTKPASKSALTRGVQSTLDKRRQAAAAAKPEGRAARAEIRKAGRALGHTMRVEESAARAPAAGLAALGKKLKLHEQMALRVVAEQAPLEARITAQQARLARASGVEKVRQARRVKALEKARDLVKEEGGRPVLASPRLQHVYDRMAKVAANREELGKQLGLLTEEAIQGRKTAALRAAQGLPLHEPKLELPKATPEQVRAFQADSARRLEELRQQGIHDYGALFAEQQLEKAAKSPKDARMQLENEMRIKQAREPQPALPEATPSATYVPDVEQRLGRSGKITATGQQGTIGTPQQPIRYGYTGGAKEHAREPLKTTRAVAESNLAVTKYARLIKLRDQLRQAAAPQPRFRDDIAIRLDKIGKTSTLPQDVKAFATDPESLAHLDPEEQVSVFNRLRSSFVYGPDKEIRSLDPAQLAEFNRLHAQGKIGWVPKALLGDLAKPHAPLSAAIGKTAVSTVDTINNAQKLAILYLKPAYAVPNLLGNAALNLIQQGFAAPANLARASRLNAKLGPELAAHVDTLMGEGIAASLRGEHGHLALATQKFSSVWGKGVDTPFRRSAFIHEARTAGYKNAAELTKLLTDPAHHDELVNVVKRANREIIDYGDLSPIEREIVRRVIFFYPWVKGATAYAGHFLGEHPVKAAATQQVGTLGYRQEQQDLGALPSYLEGLFKTGTAPSGNPETVNPLAAAILQTPAQVGAAAGQLIQGRGNIGSVGDLASFFTPALALALAQATHQTPTGKPETGGLLHTAYDTLVKGTPQYQLAQGLRGKSTSKTYPAPTPGGALGRFLIGGLYPRETNIGRLHQLAGREKKGR